MTGPEPRPDGLVYVGNGPSATGPGPGWRMSSSLWAKCPYCEGFMSLDPGVTDQCWCSSLFKDHSAGRFGCADADDDDIEIYRMQGA